MKMEKRNFLYDVALSFAGEDRKYVDEVAKYLQSQGINVFYDQFEQVTLWGKNLYEYLHAVYSKKAAFCVIFISKAYAKKVWPTHEHRSAQERAIRESHEYILPARFDDTELPGLISTTGYIDLRKMSPEDFGKQIMTKISSSNSEAVMSSQKTNYRMPKPKPKPFNQYDEAIEFINNVRHGIISRSDQLAGFGVSITSFERNGRTCIRVVQAEDVIYSFDMWLGGMGRRDSGLSFYGIPGEIRGGHGSLNAWGDMVWDNERNKVLLKLHDVSMLDNFTAAEILLSDGDFVDKIWNRIIDEIDRRNS